MRFSILILILVLVGLGSALLGRYPAAGFLPVDNLLNDDLAQRLVLNIRLPRIITAILLGMSLAAAGTVFQMIFSNPLVEPGFLGVSPGAAFGAILCIVTGIANPALVQVGALFFALAGLGISYLLAKAIKFGGWILRLVLAGIAVSAFFSAGIGLLKLTADPLSELPEITFWLLGGLWSVTWTDVAYIVPPIFIGLSIVFLLRWKLNILSLEGRVAYSLGSAADRERVLLLFAATLATAAAVSVSGLVGWAGLMVPHAARRLFGTDSRRSLPAAMLLGAIFMLLCDNVARTVASAEIPLGILTSILGAGIFLLLMTTGREAKRG